MSPAHILVVDDDGDSRELLSIVLEYEGYRVSQAASGEDALETVAVQVPDLVLLDVIMGGMDGYAVAARLKAQPLTQRISIILLTGLDDSSAKALAKAAGINDVLTKPIDRHVLCARVRSLLTP